MQGMPRMPDHNSIDNPEDEVPSGDFGKDMHSPYQNSVDGMLKIRKSSSSSSISSISSNQSTATWHASNTTRAKEHHKLKRRKFRSFTKWLMRFLEQRDTQIYRAAQEVIRDCEERKQRGESGFESVTESLQKPLRKVVGEVYWREARNQHDNFLLRGPRSTSSLESAEIEYGVPALTDSDSSGGDCVRRGSPLHVRSSSDPLAVSPLTIKSNWDYREEKTIRRERFYMILRVVMKYIESKDVGLYLRAKNSIERCISYNQAHKRGYGNLYQSIKKSVRTLVGERVWRKAETHVCKVIIRNDLRNAGLENVEEDKEQDWNPIPLSEDLSRQLSFVNINRTATEDHKGSHPLSKRIRDPSAAAFAVPSRVCLVESTEGIEMQASSWDYHCKRRRLDISGSFLADQLPHF